MRAMVRGWRSKGYTPRSPEQQVALAVRILDDRHSVDIYERAQLALGARADTIGPMDLSRNTLRSAIDRVARAYWTIPLVDGLGEELARLLGDASARTTIETYAAGGGRPMPSPMIQASQEALRYRLAAGYAGVVLDWSARTGRIVLRSCSPDDLRMTYTDDPVEPATISRRAQRLSGGEWREVTEVYDLTDLDAPSWRVCWDGGEEAQEWPEAWRLADGRPYHPVVVTGDDRHPYATQSLVEATLIVAARWTAWGAGCDDAAYPARHVRGLRLVGADSGEADSGPEVIHRWQDESPDQPGDHWQDAPGYDPDVIGRAIRTYELSAMSAMGLPVSYEQTGGEPTEQERLALEQLQESTYAECRRFGAEVLLRAAAFANRHPEIRASIPEQAHGILFGREVAAATVKETEDG